MRIGVLPLAADRRSMYLHSTQGCGRSSGVEHNLAKVRVGRSNRLARSKFTKALQLFSLKHL